MLWLWHQQSDWFSMQDEKMVDQKRFLTPPLKHGMHKKFINWNFWIANLLFFSVFFFKLLVIEMMTAWIRKGQLFCNFISVKFCCCPWSWTCCHVLQQPYGLMIFWFLFIWFSTQWMFHNDKTVHSMQWHLHFLEYECVVLVTLLPLINSFVSVIFLSAYIFLTHIHAHCQFCSHQKVNICSQFFHFVLFRLWFAISFIILVCFIL